MRCYRLLQVAAIATGFVYAMDVEMSFATAPNN
jgi:hypothetical protein